MISFLRRISFVYFAIGLSLPIYPYAQGINVKTRINKKTSWAKLIAKHPYNRSPKKNS